MSTRDKSFIKQLGLTQKDVSRALKRRQQTISSGIAIPADYFDIKKLRMLESYILNQDEITHEDFLLAKRNYLEKTYAPNTAPVKSLDNTSFEFVQMWTIGSNIKELRDKASAKSWVKQYSGDLIKTLVFALPDSESVDLAFQILAHTLSDVDKSVDLFPMIYIFEMPELKRLPTIHILDPQTPTPEAYTELYDGSMGRLPDNLILQYTQLFNEHGYGLHDEELYEEEHMLKNTDRLTLRYETENFVDGNRAYMTLPSTT